MAYRNAASAFVKELAEIRRSGSEITVRGSGTRELLARTVQLERPTERCITLPGRRNDTAISIAESMWVLAGRNDLSFLTRYARRAPDYSDDGGATWRAAYGPRLRDWRGVDQIAEVLQLLRNDPASRRAVVTLYDPAQDFVEDTKDVPCNNWLHFLIRDGRLDMNIVIRSNDIIWGFTGINSFEWSVLHEMLAHWLGVRVGTATFFMSSLHYYLDRESQVERVLAGFQGSTGYEKGWGATAFATSWDDFGSVIVDWFQIEGLISTGRTPRERVDAFPDPLLREFLWMLELYWAKVGGLAGEELRPYVDRLGESDLAFAAVEDVFRNSASLPDLRPEPDQAVLDPERFREAIVRLHRAKDESYRNAWKKRGEQVSIVSNIARKVDRIETVSAGANPGDESLLDTAIDLFVYCVKYQTFLADQDPELVPELIGAATGPFSDGPMGFEQAVRRYSLDGAGDARAELVAKDLQSLEALLATASPQDWAVRVPLVLGLTERARQYLVHVALSCSIVTEDFLRSEGV